MYELAQQYEAHLSDGTPLYLEAEDFIDIAHWYSHDYRFINAHEVMEYALKLHPEDTYLHLEQTYLYLEEGRIEEAQKSMEQIKDNTLDEVKILKANLLFAQEKEDEANQMLDSIADKEEVSNLIDMAYMYMQVNKAAKAKECIDKLPEKEKDDISCLAVQADFYYATKELEKAIVFFNKLIDTDPYSTCYWIGLARCYFELGEYNKAIDACEYALVSNDTLLEPYNIRGNSFMRLGNIEKARENFEQAIERKVLSPLFMENMKAMNNILEGKWEEALKTLNFIIESNDPNFRLEGAYANMAFCCMNLKRWEEALEYCQKAHEEDEEEVAVYLIEGRAHLEKGEIKEARTAWEKAVELAPYEDTWYEIGNHCMECGQLENSKVAFLKAKEIEPEYLDVNEKLALLCMMTKDMEKFWQYNALCRFPLTEQQAQEVMDALKNLPTENISLSFTHIIKNWGDNADNDLPY
ncbi:MAG: tetratricopeptide repeat protein [Bacteroides sp.]|nr:tetratricopeptide repeat protein [Bacteroides sp.]